MFGLETRKASPAQQSKEKRYRRKNRKVKAREGDHHQSLVFSLYLFSNILKSITENLTCPQVAS